MSIVCYGKGRQKSNLLPMGNRADNTGYDKRWGDYSHTYKYRSFSDSWDDFGFAGGLYHNEC